MKEFKLQEGGQRIYSDDLRTIQTEALQAIEKQFVGLGAFIFQGCQVQEGDTYKVSGGLCYIDGKIRKFDLVEDIEAMPQYIVKNDTEIDDRAVEQGNNEQKPTYDNFTTKLQAEEPQSGEYITLTTDGGITYWDVVRKHVVGDENSNDDNFIVSSEGKVGIGISEPDSKLEVIGDGDADAFNYKNWQAGFGKITKGHVVVGTYNDQPAIQGHGTGTSYRLLLNPTNGKVGIGTTDPKTKLHVVGSEASFTNGHGQDEGIFLIPQTIKNGQGGGRVYFKEAPSNKWGFSIGYCGDHDNPILNWPDNTFCIARHHDNEQGQVALSIKRSDGYIGIGTDNPSNKLQVLGTGDSGDFNYNHWQAGFGESGKGFVVLGTYNDQPAIQGHGTGTSYRLLLNPTNGNVGIGTTSPGAKLDVNGSLKVGQITSETPSGFNALVIKSNQTDKDAAILLRNKGQGANQGWAIHNDDSANGELNVRFNNSTKFRINTSGGISIGASSSPVHQIIFGKVNSDGSKGYGVRFTSSKEDQGIYKIVFDTPFSSVPVVVVNQVSGGWDDNTINVNPSKDKVLIRICDTTDNNKNLESEAFNFIAIG